MDLSTLTEVDELNARTRITLGYLMTTSAPSGMTPSEKFSELVATAA